MTCFCGHVVSEDSAWLLTFHSYVPDLLSGKSELLSEGLLLGFAVDSVWQSDKINICAYFLSFPNPTVTNYRKINIFSQQEESKFKEGQVLQFPFSRMEKLRYTKIKKWTGDHSARYLHTWK